MEIKGGEIKRKRNKRKNRQSPDRNALGISAVGSGYASRDQLS